VQEERLSRSLGPLEATSVVVGTIIGTGIFLKPRVIAGLLGSPPLILLVWTVGGVLSLLGALSYAELGALFPEAGGEYVFMRETYGSLPAFLWAWTYFVCAKIGSIAALGAGFAIYLKAFLPLEGGWEPGAAIGAIVLVTLVNVLGVAVGGRFQAVLTILKVLFLVGVLGLSLASPSGSVAHLVQGTPRGGGLLGAFGLALVSVLWAYDGWNDLVMVSGEIRDPGRNVVRALSFGMVLILGLYLVVNLGYHFALPVSQMAQEERVAEAAVRGVLGPRGATALSAVILVSILGALNGSVLSGARIPFAAAQDALAPRALGFVHPLYRTPSVALLVQGALSSLLIVVFRRIGIGQFDTITDMVIFAEWAFYMMCCAAVIVLRRRRPELPRPYRAWGYPYAQCLFVVCALGLVLNSLWEAPKQSGAGLILILLGLPAYWAAGPARRRAASRRASS
jgi:APA family basic amino acid/polyamine antiporter